MKYLLYIIFCFTEMDVVNGQLIDYLASPQIADEKSATLLIKQENSIIIKPHCGGCGEEYRTENGLSIVKIQEGDDLKSSLLYNKKWEALYIHKENKGNSFLFSFSTINSLRSVSIDTKMNEGLVSVFKDSLHDLWKSKNIAWVRELIGQQEIIYNKKEQLLVVKGMPMKCEDFQKIFFLNDIKKIYIEDNALNDSCLVYMEKLDGISIKIPPKNNTGKIFSSIATDKLRYIDIHGAKLKDAYPDKTAEEILGFDVWKIANLDTLSLKSAELKPKIKDIKLDSIKYLNLGESKAYSQFYAMRLRKKLQGANVQLRQKDNWAKDLMFFDSYPSLYSVEFDTVYKKYLWVPKHLTIDMCYLPVQTMRFSLGIQNYFNRYKDKYGGNYTGGTHIINFNIGAIITPKNSTKIGVELRYDYLFPRFPIFLGIGFNAYTDVKTKDFRVYARPRMGFTVPLFSLWYSHGLPLAKTYMENVPAYEIGLTFYINPQYFIPGPMGRMPLGW